MDGVLLGFSVVAVLTLLGITTAALAKDTALTIQRGLTPLVYYITNPALMVVLVSGTVFVVYGAVLRRPKADVAVGAMSSSYVNAGNIGVPIALYMVGSTAPVVAVLLAQLLVLAPMC